MHHAITLSLLFLVGCYGGEGKIPIAQLERANLYRQQLNALSASVSALDAIADLECADAAKLPKPAQDACQAESDAKTIADGTLSAAWKMLDLYEAGLSVGDEVDATIDALRSALAKMKSLVVEVQDETSRLADTVRGLGGGPDGGVAERPATEAAPEAEPAGNPQAPADPAPQPTTPAEGR